MFLFLKFCLAHLIADYLLQFEELYQLKVRSRWGHYLHAGTHLLMLLVVSIPFFRWTPWLPVYILILALIHNYQDILKYDLQRRHPKWALTLYVADQVFHYLFLSTILFFPIAWEHVRIDGHPFLTSLYAENIWTFYLIAVNLLTLPATYLFFSYRLSYVPDSRPDHYITSFETAHAGLERLWIGAWFLFAPWLPALFLSLSSGLLRFAHPKLKNPMDFTASWIYAAAVSLFLKAAMGALR